VAGKPWRTHFLYLDLIAGPGSPLETRLAFLEEGRDPFLAVLSLEDVVAQLQRQPDGVSGCCFQGAREEPPNALYRTFRTYEPSR